MRPTHRATSWIDPRLTTGVSAIAGTGVFATAPVRAAETVVIWGGEETAVWQKGCVVLDEGRYLAGPPDPSDRLNHSCDPNLWMRDAVTLVARRVIAAGDEVTIDYALFESDEAWVPRWRCRCGTPACRGAVTGRDWRLPALQAGYRGHFSPFLARRIAAAAHSRRSSRRGLTSGGTPSGPTALRSASNQP